MLCCVYNDDYTWEKMQEGIGGSESDFGHKLCETATVCGLSMLFPVFLLFPLMLLRFSELRRFHCMW